MSVRAPALSSPRLTALRQRPPTPSAMPSPPVRCELCGEAIPDEHRHLLAIDTRELKCTCRACSLLFDRPGAAEGSLRLVPDRRLALSDFRLAQLTWDRLAIPVEMAFFFYSSAARRVMAYYPGPAGATESALALPAWRQLERDNPVLATLTPDVEALLVNRARGARRYYLVPIDDPYRLVAVIRTRWRGFTGGREVWQEIDRFFADLDRRARPVPAQSTEKEG